MSYGLNIIGSNGNYQIQDGFTTFLVKSLGTVASGTNLSSYYNSANGEVLLLRPSSNSGSLYLGRNASSQTSMLCSSGNITYIVATPAKNVSPSSDTFGLRALDASGSLIFDSGAKYVLPVVNSFLPNTATAPSFRPSSAVSVAAPQYGRSRYIVYAYFFFVGVEPYGPNASYWLYPRCTWVNSTYFSFDVKTEVGAPPGAYPWYYPSNRHFLILEN